MAEHVLQLPQFSSTQTNMKKGHIPIRSISYKKTLKLQDLNEKKEFIKSFTRLMTPATTAGTRLDSTKLDTSGFDQTKSEFNKEEEQRATPFTRSAYGHFITKSDFSQETKSAYFKPAMIITHHRLSISRKNDDKKQGSYMPEIKQRPKPPAVLRKKYEKYPDQMPPPDDYFRLLFDHNRKPFVYENFEGTDDYYTDEMIQTRILNMGFRDPEYYATKVDVHKPTEIPTEDEIKKEYTFKMPVQISAMENENTLLAHVLGSTNNNIKHIESEIVIAREKIKEYKEQREKLKREIDAMGKKFDQELAEMKEEFKKQYIVMEEQIKDDFIAQQNEHFKKQKEIALLQRDKINLEKQIELTIDRLHDIENQLFGRPIFELEPNQKELDNISDINLRPEVASSMKNRQIIH